MSVSLGSPAIQQAVILAGGKGTRLKERLGDLPKPMISIGGKPLLEHQIELVKHYGFTDVLILAGYRAEVLKEHFGDGDRWGVSIRYEIEEDALGTAGAVLRALPRLADRFLVLYGDEMVNVDLHRFTQAHDNGKADASLLLHPNDHPLDSDLVELDGGGWITQFHNRPHPQGRLFQNLVNAALYVIEKRALMSQPGPSGQVDFGKDLFPATLKAGGRLFGYQSPEYIKDIGTPSRYDRVCAEYANGVIARSRLDHPQSAVFLDRDGTLNQEVGGVTRAEDLVLLPGVPEAIRALNHSGMRAVVVTNQPVVAKGFCSENDLRMIHNKLETQLGEQHAFLDRILYCPHHPEKGFAGERPELKFDCDCRKPNVGMIRRAVEQLNIDLASSWLIGDSTTDLQTAHNAGLRSILVRTGHGGTDGKYPVKADREFDSLSDAIRFVLEQKAAQ